MFKLFNAYTTIRKRLVIIKDRVDFGVEFHAKDTSFYKIIPIPKECIKDKTAIRFAAAQINNWLMSYGSPKITLHCLYLEFSYAVVEELRVRYSQIWEVLSDFYQSRFDIEFSTEPLVLDSANFFSKENYKINKTLCKIHSVGINIGQSAIKAIVLQGDNILDDSKIIIATPNTFKEVKRSIINLIFRYRAQYNVSCIGICVGGIVRWGALTTKSGVSITWSQNEFIQFQSIANCIEKEFGITTTLYQDMLCSGYSIAYYQSVKNSLVLGFGTSTGGTFINQEGEIPDFLNQVGRVAIDLSDDAVARLDGKAKGVISQYFSINGLNQLSSNDLDVVTDEIKDKLLDYAVTSICSLIDYYDPKILILTGGFWAFDTNTQFIETLKESLGHIYKHNVPLIQFSFDPAHDASIGAALMAIDTYGKLDLARQLIKSSVVASLSKYIPACIAYNRVRPGLILLNSELGRNKYIDLNLRFVKQIVNNASIDLNLNARLVDAIQLLISDLSLVGELTPQEVQSIADRVVCQVTGQPDPFKEAKQKSNLMTLELIESIGDEYFIGQNCFWTSNLKIILVFSALLNGLDVFYPESLLKFLRQFNSIIALAHIDSVHVLLRKVVDGEITIANFIGHDDFDIFENILLNNAGCKILYFIDNSGEIIFDILACLVLLQEGYKVTIVSKYEPFADDVCESDLVDLIRKFPKLTYFLNTDQLRLSSVSSDFLDYHESFVKECGSASIYLAKGNRNINFLWKKDLTIPGLHVALNKSETVQSMFSQSTQVGAPVVFVFQNII